MNHEIQDRFLIIENEIDRRIESLISELHDYRDEFRREVDEIKNRIITLVLGKYAFKHSFKNLFPLDQVKEKN